jgi:hypothetical protein
LRTKNQGFEQGAASVNGSTSTAKYLERNIVIGSSEVAPTEVVHGFVLFAEVESQAVRILEGKSIEGAAAREGRPGVKKSGAAILRMKWIHGDYDEKLAFY